MGIRPSACHDAHSCTPAVVCTQLQVYNNVHHGCRHLEKVAGIHAYVQLKSVRSRSRNNLLTTM
jgi:hypothetical protein